MKRTHVLRVALACGWLASSAPLFAQDAAAPAPANWFSGDASLLLLGRDDVDSSKFQEYREVAKGVSMPVFTLQGSQKGMDFALFGANVSRSDQRYSGHASVGMVGVAFDYNQIPHNMGNAGQSFHSETGEGVWSMSGNLRKALGDAVDAVPAAARTYPFVAALVQPTIDAANRIDVSGLRKRGDLAVDLFPDGPLAVALTYMRDVKTGYRGTSGGDIYGILNTVVDVPESMNEVTQDFGLRAVYTFKAGDVFAAFNRNLYNDRLDGGLIIDNPFRATDLAYTSTAVPGGPAQGRIGTPPDNEANRMNVGFHLKFPRMTRVAGDVAVGKWTQDAAFLPFTINTAILTPAGVSATSLSALPQPSLDGEIGTTSLNLSFVSRPVRNLSVRARVRTYDLENKTSPIVWTGTAGASPERSWNVETPTADTPYGFVNANKYDSNTKRFEVSAAYDVKDLTLEAGYKHAAFERTSREATGGDENGYLLAAVYHAREWLDVRASFQQLDRTADGEPADSIGLQSDEAERERTRAAIDVEVTPWSPMTFTFSYGRRNDDYPNRPLRVAGVADTTSGLLETKYDTYTVEGSYAPNARVEFGAFYTYEDDRQTNRWVTLTSGAVNNNLKYEGSDRGDTFGVNGRFQLVPDKWTVSFMASQSNVDGFMDITAREAGSFYTPGRTTLIAAGQGGAGDIADLDDTKWTTVVADLAYQVAQAVTFSVGYWYEKYTYADAFNATTFMFPQTPLFFMQENNGNYKVNVGYARLSYRF